MDKEFNPVTHLGTPLYVNLLTKAFLQKLLKASCTKLFRGVQIKKKRKDLRQPDTSRVIGSTLCEKWGQLIPLHPFHFASHSAKGERGKKKNLHIYNAAIQAAVK